MFWFSIALIFALKLCAHLWQLCYNSTAAAFRCLKRFESWIDCIYEGSLCSCSPWCCWFSSYVRDPMWTIISLQSHSCWAILIARKYSSQCNDPVYYKTNNSAVLLICAESEQLFNIMSQYTIWVQFYVYLTLHTQPILYSWDRQTVFAMQQKRGFSIGTLI